MEAGLTKEVLLVLIGFICGALSGIAFCIIYSHTWARYFGRNREKELHKTIKDLNDRLSKKDEYIKKALEAAKKEKNKLGKTEDK